MGDTSHRHGRSRRVDLSVAPSVTHRRPYAPNRLKHLGVVSYNQCSLAWSIARVCAPVACVSYSIKGGAVSFMAKTCDRRGLPPTRSHRSLDRSISRAEVGRKYVCMPLRMCQVCGYVYLCVCVCTRVW